MKKLKFLFKPVLIILVFLAALGLITFLSKEEPPLSSLRLSPERGNFPVGQEFNVEIILKSNEEINGVDSVLSFNPEVLEVLKIKEGTSFPTYPRKNIDSKKGRIVITGVKTRKDGKIFTQPLTFATIVFKGKKPGKAKVDFLFSKGKTTGSTIIKAQGSQNILEEVYNGNYRIGVSGQDTSEVAPRSSKSEVGTPRRVEE